ncbi:MAG: RagB/SusD family nutrient uptake outer membrane protein [Leadbetterella sp.]|nr:RagB/SusD family nutrient uptake outer membrane protein [Leadbetterella sp.]
MVIPGKLEDIQGLLDNSPVMNNRSVHYLAEISGDDYFVLKTAWQALNNAYEKNGHVWATDIFAGSASLDWNNASYIIFLANLALEGLTKIAGSGEQTEAWRNVKGSALFMRACTQYQLAQIFCKTYMPGSAASDPGIPLRMDSDMTIKTVRATVEETYRQIVKDMKEAAELLPLTPSAKTRPSRPAANAHLARVYLQMQDYENALNHASLSWKEYNTLIDYNTLDSLANYPFKLFNEEVIFHSNIPILVILNRSRHSVSPELYDSYDKDDLRKVCYYTPASGRVQYKGSYTGSNTFFTGISTGEVLVIMAECYARLGKIPEAVSSLNQLLHTRYKRGTFETVDVKEGELLDFVLKERRKELPFRGIRWSDLKRLNLDPRFAKSISRVWEDETITLEPGSDRYVLPIPDQVIKLTGIEQNVR